MDGPINYTGLMNLQNPGAALQQGIQQGIMAPLQQAQIARQFQQQQTLDAARQTFIANPTPQSVRALAALDPAGFTAIKEAHSQQTADQQSQDLRDLSAARGYLAAGRPQDAASIAQQRVDAAKKAGQDPAGPQHILDLINADPDHAKGALDYLLAGVMGPDKWAEAFGKMGEEGRANAEERPKLEKMAAEPALVQAQTAQANATAETTLHPLPKTASAQGADGNPVFYDQNAPPPAGATASTGSPALSALIPKLIGSESGGDPNAKNPNSSATGAGQFINSTWLQQVKSLRPDLADGKTDQQILAMRSDPKLSAQVTTAYAQQNAATLGQAGLPVNGATLAMSHKLGAAGAQAVLTASPNAPLSSVLPPEVIKANPQLKNLTAGQYATGLAKQFGTDAINTAPDPSATGDEYLATLAPGQAKLVKAIANGDVAAPSGSRMTPRAQALMAQVLQYDPTASAIVLPTRMATRKAFTSGLQGQAVTAGNTVGAHLAGLDIAIDQLHNSGTGIWNKPAQVIGDAVGNKQTQKALGNFDFYKHAVADELMKVFRGSNGSEAEAQGWLRQLDSAKSPTSLHSTVKAMAQGINSRLEQLQYSYVQGMGRDASTLQLFNPHSTTALKALAGEGMAANAPTVATNAQGQSVVYDPATRSWKPG